MAQLRTFIVFILLLAVIAALGYHFVYSKGQRAHPDAPKINFVTDEKSEEGLPLYRGNVAFDLVTKKTGKLIVQWISNDIREKNSIDAVEKNSELLEAVSSQVLILGDEFKPKGNGKYWVRAGILCDDNAVGSVVKFLGQSVAEKTGYLIFYRNSSLGLVPHAYCVGQFQAFYWQEKSDRLEALVEESAWEAAVENITVGVFQINLPKSFEPVSINYQSIKTYVNKELATNTLDFTYFQGYESPRLGIVLVFYGVNLSKPLRLNDLAKSARQKIKQGKHDKMLDNRSAVTIEKLGGVATVFSERFYPDDPTRLQTYDVLVLDPGAKQSSIKHTVAIVTDNVDEDENLKEFLKTFKLSAPQDQ